MAYAEKTTVTADKSRAEIEKTISRYGADQFMYGWQEGGAVVGFRLSGKSIRFTLKMPSKHDEMFALTPTRKPRKDAAIEKEWEQACRQRWRALSLVIKAKLEAVDAGISIIEEEFMANIVLPNGSTAGELMIPQIDKAYTDGVMPELLPMLEYKTD